MTNFFNLFSVMIFLPILSFAAPIPAKKIPPATKGLVLELVYGDKISKFQLEPTAKGGSVTLTNNLGLKETKSVSKKDFEYLQKKFKSVRGPSHKLEFCRRSFLRLEVEKYNLTGCLGSPTKLSRDMTSIANLLSFLF